MSNFEYKHPVYARMALLLVLALFAELLAPIGVALAQAPAAAPGTPGAPAPAPLAVPPAPAVIPSPPGPSSVTAPPGVATPAPGLPSTLTPIAPPLPGTAGQPLPAGAVPGRPPAPTVQAPQGAAAVPQPGQPPVQAPGQPPSAPGPAPAPTAPETPGVLAAPAPVAQAERAPSQVEQAFWELQAPLTVNRRLRQFGYNLFDAPSTTFAPVEAVPVGPDYVIGPGDTIFVAMWGLAEGNFQLTVDRNGQIVLPKAGPVRVSGLKFSEMEDLVRKQLMQYYQRVNISVTMGPLRTMRIFILGDVEKPGSYTVSSLATITNALFSAGGPSRQGSLREIRLIRGNRIIARLDFYRFLLEGSREGDERLLPDDTIFVPSIGPVVALAGHVKRPAIYEMKGGTSLAQLLEMAGGLTVVSYIKRVQVERVVERQRKVALDTEFVNLQDFEARTAAFPLEDGDFVSIFPIDRTLYSYVTLDGNVRRPGTYALKPGMRVRDLIEQGEGLLPGTYMARADLAKFVDGRQHEIVPLNLKAVVAGLGAANLPLAQFDRVIVYHEWDLQPLPAVQITGAVYRPGVFQLTPGMRVSDLVFKGSPSRQAALMNAELYRADPGKEVSVIRLSLPAILANPGSADDLLLADRDHMYIRQQAEGIEKRVVRISGRVRYPGEYAITQEERLSSLIQRAGGFLPDAFPKGAVFTRDSVRQVEQQQLDKFVRAQEQSLLAESAAISAGAAELTSVSKGEMAAAQAQVTAQRRELLRSLAAAVTVGRLAIKLDEPERLKGTPQDIMLEHGDALNVPQTPTSVLILGAVRNSTAVLYDGKGNIENYINQAGGATREADLSQAYILKADGTAVSSFVKMRRVEPGDAIIVPISTEPRIRTLPLLRDVATILTGFALPFAAIVALLK